MGRKLQIHLGDITRLEVDAIVSSENSDLVMDVAGGPSVSGAIRAAEGEALAQTLARLGPIEPGRAVLTPAVELPCRWIVHAATVVRTEEGHYTTVEMLRDAVRSALQLAAGLGLESMAFPAFGVRAKNLTFERASQAMVAELVEGLRHPTSLRRVVIALLHPESFLAFFEEAMKRGTQANEPLVLRVDLDQEELELAFQDHAPIAQVATTPFGQAQLAELRADAARLRSAAQRRLRDLEGEVRGLGARLHALLPAPVHERLAAEQARPLLLRLDEDLAGLPWELCWDGERTLAERTQVSRLLVIRSRTRALGRSEEPAARLEVLLLAGSQAALPAAALEAEALLDMFWRRTFRRARLSLLADRRATRRSVLEALPRVDLLHWCGHTETRGDAPCWSLAEGGGLGPGDLAGLRLRARLVVANSCGAEDPTAMARAFLLAGSRSYLGTLWDLDDELARGFALHLYEELALGHTVGEALAVARRHLRAQDPVHWAAYVHYGDPRERLFEPVALTHQSA